MANNRFFILCKCGERQYLAKCLSDGLYISHASPEAHLDAVYAFMWEHIMAEHPGLPHEGLSCEWVDGEVFKVVTE